MSGLLLFAASHRGIRAPAPTPAASVTISGTLTVGEGATTQLSATVKDADGNTLTGRALTWTSGDSGIARVDSNGLVTGVLAGACPILASTPGADGTDVQGSADLTVTAGADVTSPGAVSGLAVGTVTNLTIPLTWPLQPDPTGDLNHFRAYYRSDGTDPTLADSFQVVGSGPDSTGGTFAGPLANTTYQIALAAVDDAGNISDLSNVVSATTGDVPATNEPAGLTTMFHAQGTKLTTGADGSSANGISPAFSDTRYVDVVVDADAPFGQAVEWRWWNADLDGDGQMDDGAGAKGTMTFGHNPVLNAPATEVYFRMVIKHAPTWIHNSGGDKLMYFGGQNMTSAYFPVLRHTPPEATQVYSTYRLGYQNQDNKNGEIGSFRFTVAPSDGALPIAVGVYNTYEIHMVAQSDATDPVTGDYLADGVLQIWLNGVLLLNRSDVQFIVAGTRGFTGWEWYPHWGGVGNKSTGGLAAGDFDWLRYGELYISGKV